MRNKQRKDEVYLDVSEEQYRKMKAEGLDEESLLKPGRHKFVRGLFKQRHPDYEPGKAKVRISIYLDADVLAWFRARAQEPNAAPYQTQINNELRALMERERGDRPPEIGKKEATAARTGIDPVALLEDSQFIAALAERIKEHTRSRKRKSRAA